MNRTLFLLAAFLLLALFLASCSPQTIEVTRVVEVPGEAVEVTRVVEGEAETVEVTRIVEGTPVQEVVEVTPTPIGGELVLYACLFDPDKLEVLFQTFEEQTGVSVTCLDMSSGEALERIRAEKDNPQGDILFGTTNLSHVNLAAEALTTPYQGVGWNLLPDGPLKDPDGYWTGFYYGVIGFACSPERLAELGAPCPTSWQALLDPVYAGEIVIASPAASGTSYTVLSGLAQLYGEDGAFEYWQQLDANIAQYTESGSAPARMAAAGEFAIGIAFTHDIQVQQDNGLPVEISFPEEGTPYEIGGISIIAGARNEAAARAWVDYVFSRPFQRYHNDVAHRIPVIEGVELAEGTVTLDDVTLVEGYDPTEWAAQRDALVARWQEEIGSQR
ncbi:MAG: ABC transporter substrate-binding protein [Chloroflexi bacterium]|nr:ABC transporter substrate-binding protein [Chloroflexota bacterium]MCI0579985.1 ABC transporter substrate-binding protein [Chloroflexota bacterium]MCI0647483.1 ABC transporter substrate-binding protein [Chloroflexota bacterium]MCI0728710.1 ABC transporter substrate-binding protein [Chloroflexota bacterium]